MASIAIRQVGGDYADPSMKMVILAADAATEAELHGKETTANTTMSSTTCTTVNAGGTIPADGSCYELVFDQNLDTSEFTINTQGNTAIAIFTAHLPTEFESDTHYLQYQGTDIEPVTVVVPGQVYAVFTCHDDGTVSIGEHCTDDACGTCEVTYTNVAQGTCYMVEGLPHIVTCSGNEAAVHVYGASATGLTCSSDLTAVPPSEVEMFTHPSGVCEADAHDHGDHYDDDDHDVPDRWLSNAWMR